jgi:hypothetical protein
MAQVNDQAPRAKPHLTVPQSDQPQEDVQTNTGKSRSVDERKLCKMDHRMEWMLHSIYA